DKRYDEISGTLGFGDSHLPAVLQRCRLTAPHRLQLLDLMDSLDMGEADRARLAAACRNAPENQIVIVHGTDTMHLSAQGLAAMRINKTVVLTGAMIPY